MLIKSALVDLNPHITHTRHRSTQVRHVMNGETVASSLSTG